MEWYENLICDDATIDLHSIYKISAEHNVIYEY